MSRPRKYREESNNKLEHYSLYLDPQFDREIIEFLEPYRRTSRFGSICRTALLSYIHGTPSIIKPTIQVAQLEQPMIIEKVDDAKRRARSSFFGG